MLSANSRRRRAARSAWVRRVEGVRECMEAGRDRPESVVTASVSSFLPEAQFQFNSIRPKFMTSIYKFKKVT